MREIYNKRKKMDAIISKGSKASKMEDENEELKFQTRYLQNLNAEKELQLKTQEKRTEALRQQLIITNQELMKARESVVDIQNSTCWRLTAPLRFFASHIRGIHQPQQNNAENPVEQPMSAVVKGSASAAQQGHRDFDEINIAEYLPESSYCNREVPERIVEHLMNYDVISFDIFDTLILRYFEKPTDVFRYVGRQLNEGGFCKLRVHAEQEARKRMQHAPGENKRKDSKEDRKYPGKNAEVDIDDIYHVLSEYLTKFDIERAKEAEFQAELEACYANPYMKRIYDTLLKEGKTIVLVSDMYWPSAYLEKILKHCGYTGYHKLYVSCEYLCGKGNGKLQKKVFEELGEENSIVHIGDNKVSDIEASNEIGWDAVYYQACGNVGKEFRKDVSKSLGISIYNSLVNTHLHADEQIYSANYEHGFRYAGLMTYGFCEWLDQYAKENQIDKFLFLARDADIFYKAYMQYFNKSNIECRYVSISRLAMWLMTFQNSPEEFVQYFFQSRANQGNQTLSDALAETDLAWMIEKLKETDMQADEVLTQENYPQFHDFLIQHQDDMVEYFKESAQAGAQYLQEMIGDSKKVCAIDLGWNGSVLLLLLRFLGDQYHGAVDLRGAYLGVVDSEQGTDYVESGFITPYLFSYCMNSESAFDTATIQGDMQAKFMEATFTSSERTLLKYAMDGNGKTDFVLGIRNMPAERVEQIQQGILDFVREYQLRMEKFVPHVKISPLETLRVMKIAVERFDYCYTVLGDTFEWAFPLPNYKGKGTLTTLGRMLRDRNMC